MQTAIIFFMYEELCYFIVDGDRSHLHECYINAVADDRHLQDELNELLFSEDESKQAKKRTIAEVAEAIRNGAKLIECGLL